MFTMALIQHLCLPFLFITICFSQAFQLDDETTMSTMHEEWMARFGRVYKDVEEKEMRYAIFKDNVKYIEEFNKNMGRNYTLSTNEFADLTNEEFRAIRNGYKKVSSEVITSNSLRGTSFKYGNVTNVPSSVDWRKKGAVTAIKNQGTCGCCWAFSAVAATEGINQLKTGKLISLSEQELVDCDTGGDDQGCQGGLMDSAFRFIQRSKGLTTEANYPYRGVDGVSCNTRKAAASGLVSITGYEDVPKNNESALLQAVANQPVSVAIDASGLAFQFYSSGVFTGTCGTDLDHGVTAVGYGTSSDGTKYWLVKNSWGANWGENGYVRMKRGVPGKEGLCGIAMLASYPTA